MVVEESRFLKICYIGFGGNSLYRSSELYGRREIATSKFFCYIRFDGNVFFRAPLY